MQLLIGLVVIANASSLQSSVHSCQNAIIVVDKLEDGVCCFVHFVLSHVNYVQCALQFRNTNMAATVLTKRGSDSQTANQGLHSQVLQPQTRATVQQSVRLDSMLPGEKPIQFPCKISYRRRRSSLAGAASKKSASGLCEA